MVLEVDESSDFTDIKDKYVFYTASDYSEDIAKKFNNNIHIHKLIISGESHEITQKYAENLTDIGQLIVYDNIKSPNVYGIVHTMSNIDKKLYFNSPLVIIDLLNSYTDRFPNIVITTDVKRILVFSSNNEEDIEYDDNIVRQLEHIIPSIPICHVLCENYLDFVDYI